MTLTPQAQLSDLELQAQVRALIQRVGVAQAAHILGCSREAALRAALGLTQHPATRLMMRTALALPQAAP
jgi:hypothetical protein